MKTTSLFRSSDSSPHATAAFARSVVSQNRKPRLWLAAAVLIAALTGTAPAQVPQLINYQGRVAVNGVNFEGNGLFRFALVDGTGASYWSNSPDADPADGVPDAAVQLTVTKGLYSVLLGEATLTNMAVMPSTVFTHPDVRLRVWFDDGTHGPQLLSPDQRIAAVGYAMMAGNVPDAAITSAKLAPGAVGASNIAAGAVGTAQLADLAITGDKLRLGTETGTDAEGEITFVSGAFAFTRTFDYPFTSPPTVSLLSPGWTLGPVTNTGFSASHAFVPPVPLVLDSEGTVGSSSSLAVVDGNPAVSYYDATNGDLKYVRATDVTGSAWAAPVTVDTGGPGTVIVGISPSLAVVDGCPAISYYDSTNDDLKYVRALDPTGNTWEDAPLILDSAGDVGQNNSLAVVNGIPAVCYYDVTNGDLKYVRATDAAGTTWGIPVTPDNSLNSVGQNCSLAVVEGFPAISYRDSTAQDLKYVRAVNADGSTWGTPLAVVTVGNVGSFCSLAVVDGNPAISYRDASPNLDLKFVRATNPTGTQWESPPLTLDSTGDVGNSTSLKVIASTPMISYYDTTNGDLKYVCAADASGTTWNTPVILDGAGFVGNGSSLAEVSGKAAISYYDATNGDLKFVLLTTDLLWQANDGTVAPLTAATVTAGAIGSEQLAANAVQSGNIASGAIGSTQLAANAVQAGNIASGAIGSAQLANGAVGNAQLASNAVQAGNIASGAVGSTQIASGAIGSAQLANGAVDSSNIADGSIADADISPGAAIAPSKIADGTGSGLDADLLDGLDSASFAMAAHTHEGGSGYTKAEVDAMIAAIETRLGNVEIGMPPTPANLTATAVSWNEVQLDWSHESYFETGFHLERSMDGTNFSQIASPPANAVTYTDFDLSPVTTYYYRLRAFNPDKQTPYSNTASATTEDTTEITGILDTSFGTNGVAIHHNAAGGNKGDWGKGMALDASGRILVAGYSYSSATDVDMALWRYNPDGSIDTTFGNGGVVTHGNAAGGNSYDYGMAVAVDATGRILVAGNSIGVDATDDMVIWCYRSDGTLDSSFGTSGVVVDPRPGQDFGNAIAIDASNRILVAGCTYSVGYEMTIWRYNPNGTPDTTFDSDGVKIHAKSGTSEVGHAMVIDGAGRIVVAGRGVGSGYDMNIWCHNSDGSPDATFGTAGIVFHNNAAGGNNADYGNAVVIDANGRIVVVGHSANNFGNKDMVVWRYNSNGTLDATFDADGYVTREVVIGGTDEAYGVVMDSSGRIVVSGLAHNSAGNYDMTLWRLNPDGSADHSFDQDGFLQYERDPYAYPSVGSAIKLDSSGRILVGGCNYSNSVNADMAIWRYK
jgi:uncharacterized delta-60 repeat protein